MIPEWQAFLTAQGARVAPEPAHVLDFGDPATERMAAVTGSVLCDLSNHGLLAFTGDDAQTFLQGQLTCDVRAVTRTASRPGALCTPKGRALVTFTLLQDEQGYLMRLPAALLEPVRKRLSMYVLRSKVKIADRSTESVRLGIAGPLAAARLAEVFDHPGLAAGTPPHCVIEHGALRLLRLAGDRYELIVPMSQAPEVWKALAPRMTAAGDAVWRWAAIAAGEPMLGPATQDQFVPQMLNLDQVDGIGFQKGCYTGQEIVARTQYLGKLKQRLFTGHLEIDAVPDGVAGSAGARQPQPGDALFSSDFDGQATGMLIDAAPSPEGGYSVLAVVRSESADAHPVHWRSLDGPVIGRLSLAGIQALQAAQH